MLQPITLIVFDFTDKIRNNFCLMSEFHWLLVIPSKGHRALICAGSVFGVPFRPKVTLTCVKVAFLVMYILFFFFVTGGICSPKIL